MKFIIEYTDTNKNWQEYTTTDVSDSHQAVVECKQKCQVHEILDVDLAETPEIDKLIKLMGY